MGVNVRWVSVFGVLESNKKQNKNKLPLKKHPLWLLTDKFSRVRSENDLSPDCINFIWNCLEICPNTSADFQKTGSRVSLLSMRLIDTQRQQVEDTVFMTVVCVCQEVNIWNMSKRKLSKSHFTLWCCVIFGYLGTLSLEKPDILVKHDIISESLSDKRTVWTKSSNI